VIVIVDAANVIGSRPDGWWRDRAGAAQRLYQSLVELTEGSESDHFFLVLEGQAKAAPAPETPRLSVIRAPGSGDDTIADLARSLSGDRVVVTADRELRARCEAEGAIVHGPRWLVHQLPLVSLVLVPPLSAKLRLELMPMLVLAVVVIVVIACALYALDRALKALVRGRRRRTAAERLYAAAAGAEEKEKKRRAAEEGSAALTSVMPRIKTEEDDGPRKVA
jgi:hypothetical protein